MEDKKNKDSVLFSELFEQYKEPFTRFANSYVRDMVVAENLFVDALVGYWQRRDLLPGDTNVPSYVLASLRNRALNHMRHQRIRESVHDRLMADASSELDFRITSLENFTTGELFTAEIREIVRRTLAEMPEKTRRAFEMSRFENLKNREIAAALDISQKTVEFHISKVLKVLRVRLKDYMLFYLIFLLHNPGN